MYSLSEIFFKSLSVNQLKNEEADANDPTPVDWQNVKLPNSWVDELNFKHPYTWFLLLKATFSSKRNAIKIVDDLPGKSSIPKYVLQEFHNLPGGNYSNTLTKGYIKGFDIVMLNSMPQARQYIAEKLGCCWSVLDIGCAGAKTAAAIKAQGVTDVWAIDPSPYLLQCAAKTYKDIYFVQAIAEALPFCTRRFEGLSACYVLHEIPPKYIEKLLQEANRVLKKGGLFVIVEPSPVQYHQSYWSLFRTHGFKGMYFRLLSQKLNEPFVNAFHTMDLEKMFTKAGFKIIEDKKAVPHRFITTQKV